MWCLEPNLVPFKTSGGVLSLKQRYFQTKQDHQRGSHTLMGNGPEILLPTDTVPNNILDVSIYRITTFLDKRVNDMDNSIASNISLNQRCCACRGEYCYSRSERDQCHL